VDLDPGDTGALLNDINLEVRVDQAGTLAVGPITLDVDSTVPNRLWKSPCRPSASVLTEISEILLSSAGILETRHSRVSGCYLRATRISWHATNIKCMS